LRTRGNNSVGLASLTASSVISSVRDVLVNSKRLSSDGTLVDGDDGVTNAGRAIFLAVLILLLAAGKLLGLKLSAILSLAVGVVIFAD
jgi:hypothetical protein